MIGVVDKNTKLELIPDEISQEKWISASELVNELKNNAVIYCPWMLIALVLLSESESSMLEKYHSILSTWMNSKVKKSLTEAINVHLPENKWRLVK